METFYNGLNGQNRDIVDASSGGALLDKTYIEAYDIQERMAYNNDPWPTERSIAQNEVAGLLELDAISSLASHTSSLNNSIETFNLTANARAQQAHSIYNVVSCVFCNGPYVYDDCPQNPQSAWKQQGSAYATALQDHRPPFQQQQQHYQQPEQQADNSDALESMLKDFMARNDVLIQDQTASIKNLETQMGQLVESVRDISYETLPNNIEDPRSIGYEQIKAVALKNEKANATAKQQHCQQVNRTIRPPSPFPQRLQKQQDDVPENSTLCDIEANANLMPMNLLEKMGIKSIRSTKMTLQVPIVKS
ncbi:uncharacterized protein LOC133309540 [Gastrolobium bilobum]|uniref:uncharacterized protein LOC133309540 n=1 Tax=Gastrolobium bilobum TaxID=150636 RepID=UPI002AB0CB06|nr:uncharacterized protein LOC133309540 [Gastrolobium bilobum]